MTLRLATLCTLLAGSAAFAQMPGVPSLNILRVDDPNLDRYTFGAGQCNDTLTLGWSNTLGTLASTCSANPMKLWSTAGECGDEPGTGDTHYDVVPSQTLNTIRQGTFAVKISELPDFKTTTTDGGMLRACGSTEPFTKTHKVCGSVKYALGGGFGGACGMIQTQLATSLSLVYDTKPPAVPTITEYAAQDKGVQLGFAVDSDTAVVLLEVKGPTDGDFRQIAETSATSAEIRGAGLENNVPYDVRLRARDVAGNVSEPSLELSVTPIRTLGFWGYYKDAGGTETGGCSVGVGLMPFLLAAFALGRARKQSQSRRQS